MLILGGILIAAGPSVYKQKLIFRRKKAKAFFKHQLVWPSRICRIIGYDE